MGHNNTWSKKMRALDKRGVVLVAAIKEWAGRPVQFAPDQACDRDPWTLAEGPDAGTVRFNGQEIRPQTNDDGTLVFKEINDDSA